MVCSQLSSSSLMYESLFLTEVLMFMSDMTCMAIRLMPMNLNLKLWWHRCFFAAWETTETLRSNQLQNAVLILCVAMPSNSASVQTSSPTLSEIRLSLMLQTSAEKVKTYNSNNLPPCGPAHGNKTRKRVHFQSRVQSLVAKRVFCVDAFVGGSDKFRKCRI